MIRLETFNAVLLFLHTGRIGNRLEACREYHSLKLGVRYQISLAVHFWCRSHRISRIHDGRRRRILMPSEWALLDEEFYIEAVLYATVSSGMYDQLVQGATKGDLDAIQPCLEVPWVLLAGVLQDSGYIENREGRWWWVADPPASRLLHRIDTMWRWLSISQHFSPRDCSPFLESALQASEYERLRDSSRDMNRRVWEALSPSRSGTWLDVGGGSGTLALMLANQGLQVTMMDTPDIIQKVSGVLQHPRINLVTGDIRNTVPKGPYDIVSLIRLIENFPLDTVITLFKHIRREIRSRGRMVVVMTERDLGVPTRLFALEVHMKTDEGRLYSLRELNIVATKSRWAISRVEQMGQLTMVILAPLRVRVSKYSKTPFQSRSRAHKISNTVWLLMPPTCKVATP